MRRCACIVWGTGVGGDKLMEHNGTHSYRFLGWNVNGFGSRLPNEFVHQANVGKGTASHNIIVATTRPIRVELSRGKPETEFSRASYVTTFTGNFKKKPNVTY